MTVVYKMSHRGHHFDIVLYNEAPVGRRAVGVYPNADPGLAVPPANRAWVPLANENELTGIFNVVQRLPGWKSLEGAPTRWDMKIFIPGNEGDGPGREPSAISVRVALPEAGIAEQNIVARRASGRTLGEVPESNQAAPQAARPGLPQVNGGITNQRQGRFTGAVSDHATTPQLAFNRDDLRVRPEVLPGIFRPRDTIVQPDLGSPEPDPRNTPQDTPQDTPQGSPEDVSQGEADTGNTVRDDPAQQPTEPEMTQEEIQRAAEAEMDAIKRRQKAATGKKVALVLGVGGLAALGLYLIKK